MAATVATNLLPASSSAIQPAARQFEASVGSTEFARQLSQAKREAKAKSGTTVAPSKPQPNSTAKKPSKPTGPARKGAKSSDSSAEKPEVRKAGAVQRKAEDEVSAESPDESGDESATEKPVAPTEDKSESPVDPTAAATLAAGVGAPSPTAEAPPQSEDGAPKSGSPVIVEHATDAPPSASPGETGATGDNAKAPQDTQATTELDKKLAAATARRAAASPLATTDESAPETATVATAPKPPPASPEQSGTSNEPTPGDLSAMPDPSARKPASVPELASQPTPDAPSAPSPHAPVHVAEAPPPAPPPPPEVHFADTNHDSIVSGVRTNLLPHGGSMQIRLDPPELGALQVTVEIRDGSINATFQTSNADATRLLSHSLGQLKSALESQGVTVDKIQVQQAPRDQPSQNHEESSPQQQRDEANARQEQQRREALQKMWRRISGGRDPVDLVA